MINAGTVAAYLTLDTSSFDSGIDSAMMSISGFDAGSTIIGNAVERIKSMLGSAGDFFRNNFAASVSSSALIFTSAWGGISSVVGSSKASISSACSGIVTSASSALSRLPSSARGIMVQTGQGMVSGLTSMQPSIFAKAQSIANTVIAKMKSALGIHSPSRVMREIGRFTVEGMALGMGENSQKIREQAANAANIAIDAMSAAPAQLNYSAEVKFGGGSYGGVNSAAGEAKSVRTGSGTDLAAIADKLDRCIRLMSQTSTALEVDGRSFGRLVREYV